MLLLTTTAELSVAVFTYTNPEKFESNLLCLSLPFLLVKNDVKTRSSLLTRQVKRRYNVAGAWKHGGSSDPEPQASNSYTNAILKWRHFITRRFENWSGSGLPYLISPQVAHRLTTRGTCCFRFFSPLSFIVLPLTASVTDSMYAALEGFNYYIWWNVLSLSLCQRRGEGLGGGANQRSRAVCSYFRYFASALFYPMVDCSSESVERVWSVVFDFLKDSYIYYRSKVCFF